MKRQTWERLKVDMPLIFMATFVATLVNAFHTTERGINILSKDFLMILLGMSFIIMFSIGIGYLIIWLFYILTKKD